MVGPSDVPAITSEADAVRNPELAVLSALVHPRSDIVEAAYKAARQLDDRKANEYIDLIIILGGEVARQTLEVLMATTGEKYHSDFARKYYGEGKTEGKAEGKAEGKIEALVEGVFRVLRARAIAVSAEEETRIRECRDVNVLEVWLERAATCKTATELFV